MKLQIPLTISNSSTIQELVRFTANSLGKIQSVLNGNITFSENISGKADLINNVNTQILTFTFNAPGTQGQPHSLGYVPRGYIPIGCSNILMTIRSGTQATTENTLYLTAGSTGTLKVLVF